MIKEHPWNAPPPPGKRRGAEKKKRLWGLDFESWGGGRGVKGQKIAQNEK